MTILSVFFFVSVLYLIENFDGLLNDLAQKWTYFVLQKALNERKWTNKFWTIISEVSSFVGNPVYKIVHNSESV